MEKLVLPKGVIYTAGYFGCTDGSFDSSASYEINRISNRCEGAKIMVRCGH